MMEKAVITISSLVEYLMTTVQVSDMSICFVPIKTDRISGLGSAKKEGTEIKYTLPQYIENENAFLVAAWSYNASTNILTVRY
jgi:hypothetical protein